MNGEQNLDLVKIMPTLTLLSEIGIAVVPDGDALLLRGKTKNLTPELRETVRFYKNDILEFINKRDNPETLKCSDLTYGIEFAGPRIEANDGSQVSEPPIWEDRETLQPRKWEALRQGKEAQEKVLLLSIGDGPPRPLAAVLNDRNRSRRSFVAQLEMLEALALDRRIFGKFDNSAQIVLSKSRLPGGFSPEELAAALAREREALQNETKPELKPGGTPRKKRRTQSGASRW